MLIIVKFLASATGPLLYVLCIVLLCFTAFVGITLIVALAANEERGKRATEILRELVALFRRGRHR